MQIFLAIVNLIPSIIKIITAIEEAFPQSGIGEQKLQLVKDILSEAYTNITEMWGSIEAIVSIIVSFANKIGAFTKSSD